MADILIRGMEMPKGCGVCPFRDDECFGAWKCWRVKDWGDDDSRAKGCPLIHIPAGHGELIDKVEAYDRIAEQEGGNYIDMDSVGMGLEECQVVVPAEGGMDNGN